MPEEEQQAETIRECFAYAEQKRAEYCADDQDLWLEGYRESSLDSLEDGEFFVNVPVDAAFADLIEWNDVVDLTDDWVISGEAIDELIHLLQTAATELDQRDEPSHEYRCYAEAVPIALCEFAIERGYSVEVVD